MRSGNLPRRFLARFVLVVLIFALHYSALGDATSLEFYQDVEPERRMDIANTYEEIGRRLLLEAEKDQAGASRESANRDTAFAPKFPLEYASYLKLLRRRNEKEIMEALLENPSLLDDPVESSRASRTMEQSASAKFPYSGMERYGTPILKYETAKLSENERRRYGVSDRFQDYVEPGIPGYARNIFRNVNEPRYRPPSPPGASHRLMRIMTPDNVEDENYPIGYRDGIAERTFPIRLEEKLARMNGAERRDDETRVTEERQPIPDFTYRLDEPESVEDHPFAVNPNDPRYYETRRETFTEKLPTIGHEKSTTTTTTSDRRESSPDGGSETTPSNDHSEADVMRDDKFSMGQIFMPETRRTEHDSGLVSSSRIMNNDIYFIAIVAGCSAAAMFALVLISLTWCRLQRGAKAAADIEYPAYGVTGPNKDVSPSGDQRLAHSAQMYHFQHQKQQIIAMENRTASSRDPGSVSEAESDEENEEGDYTVYECPGLASAGEMEVKNPMFHDDPSSATSSQVNHNKEEDNI